MAANNAGFAPVVYPGQAMFSGGTTCPHCGSVADVAPEPEVKLACRLCGAPRVAVDLPDYQSSGVELGALREAEAARRSRRWWRIGGAFGGVGAAGTLFLSLLIQLIFGFGLGGTIATLIVALPFLLLAGASIGRSSARTAQVKQAIHAAWVAVAKDVARRSKQPMTAEVLGKALRLPDAETEQVLAELDVEAMLRSEAPANGGLGYASTMRIDTLDKSGPPPPASVPVRVQTDVAPPVAAAAPPAAPAPPAAETLDAELERMAAAEIAAREVKAKGP